MILCSFELPERVQQLAAIDDTHICLTMGSTMQIYVINSNGWDLVAQTTVGDDGGQWSMMVIINDDGQ